MSNLPSKPGSKPSRIDLDFLTEQLQIKMRELDGLVQPRLSKMKKNDRKNRQRAISGLKQKIDQSIFELPQGTIRTQQELITFCSTVRQMVRDFKCDVVRQDELEKLLDTARATIKDRFDLPEFVPREISTPPATHMDLRGVVAHAAPALETRPPKPGPTVVQRKLDAAPDETPEVIQAMLAIRRAWVRDVIEFEQRNQYLSEVQAIETGLKTVDQEFSEVKEKLGQGLEGFLAKKKAIAAFARMNSDADLIADLDEEHKAFNRDRLKAYLTELSPLSQFQRTMSTLTRLRERTNALNLSTRKMTGFLAMMSERCGEAKPSVVLGKAYTDLLKVSESMKHVYDNLQLVRQHEKTVSIDMVRSLEENGTLDLIASLEKLKAVLGVSSEEFPDLRLDMGSLRETSERVVTQPPVSETQEPALGEPAENRASEEVDEVPQGEDGPAASIDTPTDAFSWASASRQDVRAEVRRRLSAFSDEVAEAVKEGDAPMVKELIRDLTLLDVGELRAGGLTASVIGSKGLYHSFDQMLADVLIKPAQDEPDTFPGTGAPAGTDSASGEKSAGKKRKRFEWKRANEENIAAEVKNRLKGISTDMAHAVGEEDLFSIFHILEHATGMAPYRLGAVGFNERVIGDEGIFPDVKTMLETVFGKKLGLERAASGYAGRRRPGEPIRGTRALSPSLALAAGLPVEDDGDDKEKDESADIRWDRLHPIQRQRYIANLITERYPMVATYVTTHNHTALRQLFEKLMRDHGDELRELGLNATMIGPEHHFKTIDEVFRDGFPEAYHRT